MGKKKKKLEVISGIAILVFPLVLILLIGYFMQSDGRFSEWASQDLSSLTISDVLYLAIIHAVLSKS